MELLGHGGAAALDSAAALGGRLVDLEHFLLPAGLIHVVYVD